MYILLPPVFWPAANPGPLCPSRLQDLLYDPVGPLHLLGVRGAHLPRGGLRQLRLVFLAQGLLRLPALWQQARSPRCQDTGALCGRAEAEEWARERVDGGAHMCALHGRLRGGWGKRGGLGQKRTEACGEV
jgi:hypothetical protein